MVEKLQSEQIHEIIKSNLPLGFSIVNQEGVIVDFNEAAESITGFVKDEVIGQSHFQLLHGSSDKESCPLLNRTLRNREREIASESTIRKKNGDFIIIAVTTFPLIDEKGKFYGGVELFRDITSMKKMERERKNILSMFAHDMKNPIITSETFLARLLAEKGGGLNAKQKTYLETIESNLHNVESLLANFLEFSRLETNEIVPEIEAVDIASAINRVVLGEKMEADNRSITIYFENTAKGPVVINADPMLLDRAITNLVGNAIKYTEPGGRVEIALSKDGENVRVRFSDTGVGIAEEQLPYVFDAFFRVSGKLKGSGLGLAITKSVIELHGGRLWVESVPGKGSVFSFQLPL